MSSKKMWVASHPGTDSVAHVRLSVTFSPSQSPACGTLIMRECEGEDYVLDQLVACIS